MNVVDLSTKSGAPGAVEECRGYYVDDDMGGGLFSFAQTQFAPNGGTIIDAPNGQWFRQCDPSDIDVRWFGAWGASGWPGTTPFSGQKRSNLDAFQAAIRSLSPSCVPTFLGPRIRVPAGRYDFTDTLVIDRAASLEGVGWGGLEASWLNFPAGKHGVHVYRDLPPPYPPPSPPVYQRPRGDYSTLAGLRIAGGAAQGSPNHGLLMNAATAMRDCFITLFGGDGVHGDCSVPAANANGWQFERTRVDGCGGSGFYFNGSDANAGCGIGLSVTSCGGWAILDESFLGNYFFGCHSASCYGSWKTTNANARSVFVGCYSEGDQNPASVQMPSMIIGGINGANTGTGGYLGEGDGAMRLRNGEAFLENRLDLSKVVRATLGSQNVPYTAMEIRSGTGATLKQPYRLKYDDPEPGGWADRKGWWSWEFANMSAGGAAFRFCDDQAAEWNKGLLGAKIAFDNGFYMGRAIRVGTFVGEGPPTTGTWGRGDRIYDQTPTAGGVEGWVCVVGGTPGTWKAFGSIAP